MRYCLSLKRCSDNTVNSIHRWLYETERNDRSRRRCGHRRRSPKGHGLEDILRSSFLELARTNGCKATAAVFNVAVTLPESNCQSDAIQFCLDHAEAYSVEVFFPYRPIENEIVYQADVCPTGPT